MVNKLTYCTNKTKTLPLTHITCLPRLADVTILPRDDVRMRTCLDEAPGHGPVRPRVAAVAPTEREYVVDQRSDDHRGVEIRHDTVARPRYTAATSDGLVHEAVVILAQPHRETLLVCGEYNEEKKLKVGQYYCSTSIVDRIKQSNLAHKTYTVECMAKPSQSSRNQHINHFLKI